MPEGPDDADEERKLHSSKSMAGCFIEPRRMIVRSVM
jgi:hypothetical protein